MCDKPLIALVGLFIGCIQSNAKLFFRFGPISLDDQAQPVRVSTFYKSLRIGRGDLCGFIKQFQRVCDLSAPAGETCERMKSLGLTSLIAACVKKFDRVLQNAVCQLDVTMQSPDLGAVKQHSRKFIK